MQSNKKPSLAAGISKIEIKTDQTRIHLPPRMTCQNRHDVVQANRCHIIANTKRRGFFSLFFFVSFSRRVLCFMFFWSFFRVLVFSFNKK